MAQRSFPVASQKTAEREKQQSIVRPFPKQHKPRECCATKIRVDRRCSQASTRANNRSVSARPRRFIHDQGFPLGSNPNQ